MEILETWKFYHIQLLTSIYMNYIQIASTGEDNHNRDVQAEVVQDALAVGFFKGAAPRQSDRLLEVSSCLAQGF